MRINRGCGCVLLVLAAVNLLFLIAAIVGLFSSDRSLGLILLAMAVFGANMLASFLLGLAGLRGLPLGAVRGTHAPEAEGDFEGADSAIGEGED